MRKLLNTLVILALLIAVLGVSAPSPDTVVVVFESSESIPDPYVTGALKTLASEGLQTRVLDKDVRSGGGKFLFRSGQLLHPLPDFPLSSSFLATRL